MNKKDNSWIVFAVGAGIILIFVFGVAFWLGESTQRREGKRLGRFLQSQKAGAQHSSTYKKILGYDPSDPYDILRHSREQARIRQAVRDELDDDFVLREALRNY
jgi:hypothetical protein